MREAKRQYWIALLARCSGNVSQAAREAKVRRQAVYVILKRYEIQRKAVLIRQGRWAEFGL
jgi:transcriptional regulator of acetoin/glycerol metabolism